MYEIKTDFNAPIDFSAMGNNAIIQNARFLLSTIISSCPMDRNFGWDPPLDEPGEFAKVKTSAEIFDKFKQNIPELIIKDIQFYQDHQNGLLQASVKVEINNG